jgi:hypothetical protein
LSESSTSVRGAASRRAQPGKALDEDEI